MSKLNNNLWIFVDETGTISPADVSNLIFGLGILFTQKPEFISNSLSTIKYSLWSTLLDKKNKNQEIHIPQFFHAKNNPRPFKKEFYKKMKKFSFDQSTSQFIFKYLEKEKFNSKLNELLAIGNKNVQDYSKETLFLAYGMILQTELCQIFAFIKAQDQKVKVNVVLSKIFSNKEESLLSRHIAKIATDFKIKCNVMFVDNNTDYCCQLADYFSWSCSRKIVKNEDIGYSYLVSKWNIKESTINFTDEVSTSYDAFLKQFNKKIPYTGAIR